MMLGVAVIYALTSTLGKGAMQDLDPRTSGLSTSPCWGWRPWSCSACPNPADSCAPWAWFGPWRAAPWAILAVVGLNALMVSRFLALQRVQVAYMISVKRVSLLLGILYGAWLFHEPGLETHLPAGALMLAGIFLIALT